MSASDKKRFRVVVVGVAKGHDISAQELAGSLQEYFPLAPDAQVAIETGRSAVVQVAESEHNARRAATMLIKLGAEIRIEPDSISPGPLEFDDIDLDGIGDNLDELELDHALSAKSPFSEEATTTPLLPKENHPDPVLISRPPVDEDPLPHAARGLASQGTRRPTRELDAVRTATARTQSAPREVVHEAPTPSVDEASTEAPTKAPTEVDDTPEEAARGGLVRCPSHGLLYDPTQSPGCTRCLGPRVAQPFRLAPELRQRPRLWLTLGLALGLLLGAVPAALYAQNVKSGTLYDRRIEADTLRQSSTRSKQLKQQYNEARAKITATRNRGIAFSALLWIGVAAVLMLLWYRFV